MRTLLTLLAAAGVAAPALAQGTVDFNNNVSFTTPGDRLVYASYPSVPLVGTDHVAQLYYGRTPYELHPGTNAPAQFRVATTTIPGTWSGGSRTLVGFDPGETVWLQVRVWDATLFPSYESAVEAGDLRWASCPFTYTVPVEGSPPGAFFMENFRGNACLDCCEVGWFSCWRSGNLLLLDWMSAEVTQTRNLADPLWESVTNRVVSMTNEASFLRVQPAPTPPPGGR